MRRDTKKIWRSRRRCRPLSPKVKKLVWAETKLNAGAGWWTRYKSADPRVVERGQHFQEE